MRTANPESRKKRAQGIVHAALGAGVLVILGSGCLHHPNIAPCPTDSVESECWESSRSDKKGHVRHLVVERIEPGSPCDIVRVEQTSFDADGYPAERTIDYRRCNVVDRRIVDRYDLARGQVIRTISTDRNHDDRFDRVVVSRMPLSESDAEYDSIRESDTIMVTEDKQLP